MANQVADATHNGKRVTVLFNPKDWKRILQEQKKRSREAGYKMSISDVLRAIVKEALGGE